MPKKTTATAGTWAWWCCGPAVRAVMRIQRKREKLQALRQEEKANG